jgi:PhnB protein
MSVQPVIPHLVVRGGTEAIAFYEKAFGARLENKVMADDGQRVMHAHLALNGGAVMLADDFGTSRDHATPLALGGTAVTIHLEVDDADEWWQRALDAGASVVFPLDNQFWGARYGQLKDPFGHVWSIGGPLKK